MFLVLLMYMLFASTFTVGKMALDYAQPIFFIGIRMICGGSLLLAYQYFFNRTAWRFEYRHLSMYVRIALFHIFIAYVAEFWALVRVTAAKASLLYNLSPFITALFAYYALTERLTLKKWFGLGIGFFGFVPLLMTYMPQESVAGNIGVISTPEVALLISVIASCYGWIVFKQLVVHYDYSPVMVNGVGMLSGGLLALIVSLLFEKRPLMLVPAIAGPVLPPFLWLTFYTGVLILITNIICYNLYGALLKRYSATFLSFAGFTTPLFAALFGWFLRSETVSWDFIVSMLIIFCGLYFFYSEELYQEQTK